MTKQILSLLPAFVLFLASCKSGDEKRTDRVADSSIVGTTVSTNAIKRYDSLISALDTTNVQSVSIAANQFDRFFAGVDTITADSAYQAFEVLYAKVGDFLNETHLKDGADYSSYLEEDQTKNLERTPQKDAFVKKLTDNGYTLDMSEGMTYIRQKRKALSHYFYPHVSNAMRLYLEQMDKENEEGFVEDAGLMVTPLVLAERLLWRENFLKKHPNFCFSKELNETGRGYMTFLLEGIDNTPLLSYETHQIDDKFKEAYEEVLKSYPNSQLASIIRPYYEALKSKNKDKQKQLLKQYKKQQCIYDYSA